MVQRLPDMKPIYDGFMPTSNGATFRSRRADDSGADDDGKCSSGTGRRARTATLPATSSEFTSLPGWRTSIQGMRPPTIRIRASCRSADSRWRRTCPWRSTISWQWLDKGTAAAARRPVLCRLQRGQRRFAAGPGRVREREGRYPQPLRRRAGEELGVPNRAPSRRSRTRIRLSPRGARRRRTSSAAWRTTKSTHAGAAQKALQGQEDLPGQSAAAIRRVGESRVGAAGVPIRRARRRRPGGVLGRRRVRLLDHRRLGGGGLPDGHWMGLAVRFAPCRTPARAPIKTPTGIDRKIIPTIGRTPRSGSVRVPGPLSVRTTPIGTSDSTAVRQRKALPSRCHMRDGAMSLRRARRRCRSLPPVARAGKSAFACTLTLARRLVAGFNAIHVAACTGMADSIVTDRVDRSRREESLRPTSMRS